MQRKMLLWLSPCALCGNREVCVDIRAVILKVMGLDPPVVRLVFLSVGS